MRLISVNGETAVHHVDERPWKCTIRLLSGNKISHKALFHTPTRNTTKQQVKSGVFEKSTHHFALKESTPFGIIRTGIRTTPAAPFTTRGIEGRLKP